MQLCLLLAWLDDLSEFSTLLSLGRQYAKGRIWPLPQVAVKRYTSWTDVTKCSDQCTALSLCVGITRLVPVRKQSSWGPRCFFAWQRHQHIQKWNLRRMQFSIFSSCTKGKMIYCIAPQSLMSASYSHSQIREWQIWSSPSEHMNNLWGQNMLQAPTFWARDLRPGKGQRSPIQPLTFDHPYFSSMPRPNVQQL